MTYTITNPARLLPAMRTHRIVAAAWNWEMLHPAKRREVVDRTKAALAKLHFDAIAVCGLSGLLIGNVIAMEMDKALIVVRKRGEDRHSGLDVEGDLSPKTYVILDDFVSSGSTICRIERKIQQAVGPWPGPRCLGVLEYGSCYPRWTTRRDWGGCEWYETAHEDKL